MSPAQSVRQSAAKTMIVPPSPPQLSKRDSRDSDKATNDGRGSLEPHWLVAIDSATD